MSGNQDRLKLVPYDHRKFWRWLNERVDGEIVGYNRDSSRCPLKKCFGQAVDERGYRVPQWADNYLWHIDSIGKDLAKSYPVSKEDALRAWHATFKPIARKA